MKWFVNSGWWLGMSIRTSLRKAHDCCGLQMSTHVLPHASLATSLRARSAKQSILNVLSGLFCHSRAGGNLLSYLSLFILLSLSACTDYVQKIEERNWEWNNGQAPIDPLTVVKGEMTDTRDGQTYKTVTIGTQTWMAQNLNYKTENSFCYNDEPANCSKYGRLYTWNAAMMACPSGWHLPTMAEFEILVSVVGGEKKGLKRLKSTSSNGSDDYSFAALPSGFRSFNGVNFGDEGLNAYFWSSTDSDDRDEWAHSMHLYINDNFNDDGFDFVDDKASGQSVRCLKNDGETIESSSNDIKLSSSVMQSSSSEYVVSAADAVDEVSFVSEELVLDSFGFADIANAYRSVAPDEKVVFVLRNAERELVVGKESSLTEDGALQAQLVGQKLVSSDDFVYAHTDYERAKQTACNIALGRGQVQTCDESFVSDMIAELTGSWFVKDYDLLASYADSIGRGNSNVIVALWLYDGLYADAFYDLDVRGKEIVDTYLIKDYAEMSKVKVVVSHDDTFIAPLIAYGTQKQSVIRYRTSGKWWINYLTGVAIIVNSKNVIRYIGIKGLDSAIE